VQVFILRGLAPAILQAVIAGPPEGGRYKNQISARVNYTVEPSRTGRPRERELEVVSGNYEWFKFSNVGCGSEFPLHSKLGRLALRVGFCD
jgi:hypothetical protein